MAKIDTCDDDAVEQVAQQRRLLEGGDVVVDDRPDHAVFDRIAELDAEIVAEQLLRAEQPAGVGHDLGGTFHRVADHHIERQQHDHRTEDQHHVLERFGGGEPEGAINPRDGTAERDIRHDQVLLMNNGPDARPAIAAAR
jgi:hypothetical protein